MIDLIAAADPRESALLDGLHVRLERSAAAAQSLDIAYRTIDSPIGGLLLARTPVGLVRVAFAVQDLDAVLDELARLVSPRILRSAGSLDAEARGFEAYFAGSARLDLPLDWRLSCGFRRQVRRHLVSIPYGRTESYAQVAAAVGRPAAVRATGSACATNPLPIVVPCHRVVRSDGSLGGYLAGLNAKRTLLQLESLNPREWTD